MKKLFKLLFGPSEIKKLQIRLDELTKTPMPKIERSEEISAFYKKSIADAEQKKFNNIVNKHNRLFSDVFGTKFGTRHAETLCPNVISWSYCRLKNGCQEYGNFQDYFHLVFGKHFTVNTEKEGHFFGWVNGYNTELHVTVSDDFEKEYKAFVKQYCKWRNSRLQNFNDAKVCTMSNKMGYIKDGVFTPIGENGISDSEIFEEFLRKEKDYESVMGSIVYSLQEKMDKIWQTISLANAMNKL